MNDHPQKNGTAQIVGFPNAEERARRLRAEVERLSRLPTVEWMFYLDDTAAKYGIGSTKLKAMITAVIRDAEKKAKEDRGLERALSGALQFGDRQADELIRLSRISARQKRALWRAFHLIRRGRHDDAIAALEVECCDRKVSAR